VGQGVHRFRTEHAYVHYGHLRAPPDAERGTGRGSTYCANIVCLTVMVTAILVIIITTKIMKTIIIVIRNVAVIIMTINIIVIISL
jgi:hypothetical protein